MMMKMIKFHEGKTKITRGFPSQIVQIALSDNVTAGDGTSKIQVLGKGALSCTIATNCFRLLKKHHVPVSFISAYGPNSFMALYTSMAPVEVVCRGIATGSYLKRNPDAKEGDVFDPPVVEFFFKDDARHDPLIDPTLGLYSLHKPNVPVSAESLLGELDFNDEEWTLWGESMNSRQIETFFSEAKDRVLQVYSILREAWSAMGFTLVDLKIEVGVCSTTGEVMVSDAITPDEWRLWKNGDVSQAFDKDPFRKSQEKDGDEIKRLLIERYTAIADLTSNF